jgi:hypothetical protein
MNNLSLNFREFYSLCPPNGIDVQCWLSPIVVALGSESSSSCCARLWNIAAAMRSGDPTITSSSDNLFDSGEGICHV